MCFARVLWTPNPNLSFWMLVKIHIVAVATTWNSQGTGFNHTIDVSFNSLRSYAPWWPRCKCLHPWSRDQGHVNTGLTVSRGHVGHTGCINRDVIEATQVNIISVWWTIKRTFFHLCWFLNRLLAAQPTWFINVTSHMYIFHVLCPTQVSICVLLTTVINE